MEQIGIGLIGCGSMGVALAKRLLDVDSRIKVKAIFDPDDRSIKNALSVFGDRVKIYEDYHQLVNASEVDWVMIASWNCYHREQVIAAFEAGKHVFCQKPLATNLDDCIALHRTWQISGMMFNIGLTLRYSPHYRKIKQLLEEGAIGKIISLEFNETLDFNHGGYIMGDWRRLTKYAGSHLLEKCCHDIDLINWLVASKARRVASFGGLNFFKPGNEHHIQRIGKNREGKSAYMTWNSLVGLNPFTSDKDIVDNQVAIFEFENGVRATFHTNCNAGIPERRMVILGTEGAIRADVLTGKIEVRHIGFETNIEDRSTDAKGGHGDGDAFLVSELADSMLNGTPPSVGMDDALLSSITCFAINEAMDKGEVIHADKYWEQVSFMK
jgi:predicted dehydrogenase